jgi:hypothetical protein
LTATTTSGEKTGGRPSGAFFEAHQSLLEEALATLGDDLASGVEAGGDLVDVEPFSGHEHDLGSHYVPIRATYTGEPALRALCRSAVNLSRYGPFLGMLPSWRGAHTVGEAPDYVIVVT